MDQEINNLLTYIECIIINAIFPEYLEISYQDGFLYILLSKKEYKFYSLSERQESIFNLLKIEIPDIMEKYPIIVEVFDSNELDGLMKLYANKS